MDIANLTFTGLLVIGTVNVYTYFRPKANSSEKWVLAFIVALAAGYVPVHMANEIAQRIKEAVEIVLASSGGYKVAMKAGGN